MAQLVAAAYRLDQEVEVVAGSGLWRQTRRIGLRGWTCRECTAGDKQERGCASLPELARAGLPLVPLVADLPVLIDYTGDRVYDRIRTCPVSAVPESVRSAVSRIPMIKAAGGLMGWYGSPAGHLPPRVSWLYTIAEAVESRFLAEIKVSRREAEASFLEAQRKAAEVRGR